MNDIRYGRKRSGIEKQLKEKVDDWIKSIDDPNVQKACMKNTIVTGGSIASMLLGESVNDYDIYFRDYATTVLVANYYVNKFNESPTRDSGYAPMIKLETVANIKGQVEDRVSIYVKSEGTAEDPLHDEVFDGEVEDEEMPAYIDLNSEMPEDEYGIYKPVFMSQNAITLSDKVQIVIRFYGEPDKIHDNYDFQHAMCYWDHGSKTLNLPAEALECLLSRTLVYRGSLYPIASVFRTKKFLERGWRISAGQQLKMMWQISEIDLSDHKVMAEQLTGVDQAYLHMLITALKDVDSSKIDSTYVSTLIDKIF